MNGRVGLCPAAWSFAALLSVLAGLLWSTPALASPNPAVLADGRKWELVSPPDKHGATIDPLGVGKEGPLGGLVQASEDGSSLTYVATSAVESEPEANRSPEGIQLLSTRASSAWSTSDIITPHTVAEGLESGVGQEYKLFSGDLSLALLLPPGLPSHPLQEPPLTPLPEGATEQRGIYLRSNAKCEATPAGCYEALVTPANDTTGAAFGGELKEILGASPDFSHVLFKSAVALTSSPTPSGPGLYEWTKPVGEEPAGKLQLVSVLPPAEPGAEPEAASEAQLGNDVESVSESARNAVSSDGSRVFWISNTEGVRDNLYVRDTGKGVTIQLNVQDRCVKGEPCFPHFKKGEEGKEQEVADNEVRYQTANAKGTKVFFADSVPLTKESKQPLTELEKAKDDLYVCELPEPPAELTATSKCKLKDLSVKGDVLGAVLGTSEDGSWVYFAANGILAENENANHEKAAKGTCIGPRNNGEVSATQLCNLYVEHYNGAEWEKPRFIAKLSGLDNPDWAGKGTRLFNLTARVSPNGRYLAFMSERELTGQSSVDASPAAKGAHDEEVFMYDASTERLVCPSCNPNGAQPTGVFDVKSAGEGVGLVVDPDSAVWSARWLAGSIPGWTPLSTKENPSQSRYLLDNGRLFFNSADRLTPEFEHEVSQRTETIAEKEEKVGVENVYQYEPASVGSCEGAGGCVSLISARESPNESAFLEASVSGNDVFFLTAQQLVSSDVDTNFDAYDAHVCSEASPCITPPSPPAPACDSEASCRRPPPTTPGFEGPISSTFSGPVSVAKQETKPSKEAAKPKTLTRSQRLSKALASCRKQFKHAKKKRARCERQARQRYGAKKAAHHGSRRK